ncbi:hypothetical protein EYB45_02895 [Erythrobacteraceae bacterium CFH 75059]|uniref:hypothetical protein n=1 Tax=Qipengyuania thermophila TaxID=2509361 RepID=UPI00102200A2|nr:hypothetical protein [Qipengyuania thermophila]TCD06666.1 hypothetical protein EYB45_02895 [Erythrobacteraceae bacterium CFH 75059]
MSAPAATARALLASTTGWIVWAVAFSVLYGVQGLSCAYRWNTIGVAGTSLAQVLLCAIWLAFIAVLGWLCWRLGGAALVPGMTRLLRFVALVSAIGGLVATVWTGIPVVFTSVCL